jgi:hypothetical protein
MPEQLSRCWRSCGARSDGDVVSRFKTSEYRKQLRADCQRLLAIDWRHTTPEQKDELSRKAAEVFRIDNRGFWRCILDGVRDEPVRCVVGFFAVVGFFTVIDLLERL